jgi:CHAT domain-containing protein
VSYAPSATALRFLGQPKRREFDKIASVGVEFEQEAHEVARVFGINAVVGKDATRDRFRECLSGNHIVHFSGHGSFHAANPLSSALQLSDGVITAREIMESKIDADLVTLSACESGMNRMTDGDDIIGFARAFFHAGASSLIASLWRVEAESTKTLMGAFYSELVSGASKRSALQSAQSQLLQDKEDPYYWAPFLLFGDWK